MRIMILTAATGGGHKRAAHAAEEGINRHSPHTAFTVDALKTVGKAFDDLICGSYLFMARRQPAVFGRLYRMTNKRNAVSDLTPKLLAEFNSKLLRLLEEEQPDAVISTHPFAATMMGALKKAGKTDIPLVSIITDYGAHREYLADNCAEAYVVACDDMVEELGAWGVPPEKVYPIGIPVHEAFFERPDRTSLRQELGLDPDLPTVLFMAGSFGVSNIIGLYRDLERSLNGTPLQTVIITGKNQRLYDRFREEIDAGTALPTSLILFTDQVERYMHAADLLVTKPGGLTVSEALASGLPMAAFDAIPGQEEDNAAFLERHGMALRLKPDSDFAGEITGLMGDPARLAAMRAACEAFDKSSCIPRLTALLEDLAARREEARQTAQDEE